MRSIGTSLIPHILLFLFSCSAVLASAGNEDRQNYIVYMGKLPDEIDVASQLYANMLSNVLGSSSFVPGRLIKSYMRSFNGFVAKLTRNEADNFKGQEGVVSVFPDRVLHLQTTRSWDFLLGAREAPRKPQVESDIIIGVLDSGIWPESESFGDAGIGPVPKKWRGVCKGGANFTCNRKLIGARFYGLEMDARDEVGHGSHTASTAAGRPVKNVSFYGVAAGTARGGVPASRIAVYKPCGLSGCNSSDILSAFDDAIADGVDIITASVGSDEPSPIEEDVLAIGSFHALAKGIVTTQSAGNNGPVWQTTSSTAPWILSVAASTFDRQIISTVVTGTKTALVGRSANGFEPTGFVPIVYGKDAGDDKCNEAAVKSCEPGCVVREKVSGKILVCDNEQAALETGLDTGVAGVVTPLTTPDISFVSPLPTTSLFEADYNNLLSYLSNTSAPKANILKSRAIVDRQAPLVATFSSSGPNANIADIMKPDVTAPGVDILAAYSPVVPASGVEGDPRRVAYNFLSGTSMACPHVAGIAAYVKSFHPTWSPSVIKSAIMTTARPIHQEGADEFSYGSGHVDPRKALFPGLVYEIPSEDYVKVLCTVGINAAVIAGVSCSKLPKLNARDLNYPAVTLSVNVSQPFSFNVPRTVTNVGPSHSTYKATIVAHPRVKVAVSPSVLHFEKKGQKKSFSVSVSVPTLKQNEVLSSSLIWSDGRHAVKSPIVAFAP